MANESNRDFLDSAALSRLSRLQVSARMPMSGSITGIHKSATRGSSVEFAEYRKYVPGDDIGHVDWRVYGRTDRFYMKEFEADTNLRCNIIIDSSASMGFTGENGSKLDYARRIAATLSYLLVHQGDAVGLNCFNDKIVNEIPPRHTPSHLKNIFDTLAQLTPGGQSKIVDVLHDLAEKIRRRSLVIILSDLFTDPETLIDCFQHMKFHKHDVAVFHLVDRQEVDFDFDRPIRFNDLESSFNIITDPSVIKNGYKEAFNNYLSALKKGCLEFHVDYHLVHTDLDYEKAIAAFLLRRIRTH